MAPVPPPNTKREQEHQQRMEQIFSVLREWGSVSLPDDKPDAPHTFTALRQSLLAEMREFADKGAEGKKVFDEAVSTFAVKQEAQRKRLVRALYERIEVREEAAVPAGKSRDGKEQKLLVPTIAWPAELGRVKLDSKALNAAFSSALFERKEYGSTPLRAFDHTWEVDEKTGKIPHFSQHAEELRQKTAKYLAGRLLGMARGEAEREFQDGLVKNYDKISQAAWKLYPKEMQTLRQQAGDAIRARDEAAKKVLKQWNFNPLGSPEDMRRAIQDAPAEIRQQGEEAARAQERLHAAVKKIEELQWKARPLTHLSEKDFAQALMAIGRTHHWKVEDDDHVRYQELASKWKTGVGSYFKFPIIRKEEKAPALDGAPLKPATTPMMPRIPGVSLPN